MFEDKVSICYALPSGMKDSDFENSGLWLWGGVLFWILKMLLDQTQTNECCAFHVVFFNILVKALGGEKSDCKEALGF